MGRTIYESCADTAKKVRQVLKQEFPGVKFSVRSDTYSMGSSIRVSWTDGPTKSMVERRVGFFGTKNFDGMTDSSSYGSYEWEGQQYSGTDYVFCDREMSKEYQELVETTGAMIYGPSWNGTTYQMNEAEAELNGQFPYNRMNEKTNRRSAR